MKGNKIVNLLLIVSLIINSVFIYLIKFSNNDIVKENTNAKANGTVTAVYDLRKYESTSYPNQNLEVRFNRIYEQYLKDKQSPVDDYYTDGKVDEYWYKKCMSNLKRIVVLSAKIQIIETTLNNVIDASEAADVKKELDLLVETKGYHEKLLDMSNFYARFLSDESYAMVQQTLD